MADYLFKFVISFLASQFLVAAIRICFGRAPSDWVAMWLHVRHPRRYRDAIRWALATVIGFILWGVYADVAAWIASYGPHEGDPAEQVIRVVGEPQLLLHSPGSDTPLRGAINFTVDGKEEARNACAQGFLILAKHEISKETLARDFKLMFADIELADIGAGSAERCGTLAPSSQNSKFIYARSYITDQEHSRVLSGDSRLYAAVVWEYQLPGSDKFYAKEYCAYQTGNSPVWYECHGPFNGTFVHLVNK